MSFQKSARYFLSEFLCTMLLVCLTCLSCTPLENSILPLSVAYGLIHLVLHRCFQPFSGAYANPSVSLAMWIRGYMRFKKLMFYVVAEILGGIFGHFVANKFLGKSTDDTLCAFSPKADLSNINIMLIEFMLTFLLIMSWCALVEYESELPMEMYLALVNALLSILGGYLTGASTNPARTLAPVLFVEKAVKTHICLTGQLLGGIAAPLLWSYLDKSSKTQLT